MVTSQPPNAPRGASASSPSEASRLETASSGGSSHVLPDALVSGSVPVSEAMSVAARIRLAERELAANPGPRLTLVIPMFNEARRIESSLRQLSAAGLDGIRLVLVDDGSTDDTVDVARRCIDALALPEASVLPLGRNVGKGGAVRAGVATADTPLVGFVDADLSLDPIEIRRAMHRLDVTTHDLVVGERVVDRAEQPKLRRLASLVFRKVTGALAPTGVADPQCALKLFRADAARAVFGPMITDGFSFDVELLLRARRASLSVDEMAVRWTHQPGSKVSPFSDAIAMVRDVRRIAKHLR